MNKLSVITPSSKTKQTNQRGVATLVTAVVLMLAVIGISFIVSETVISEKQIVSSDFKARQAFMAAQAGIDYGRIVAQNGACIIPCTPSISGASVTVTVSAASGSNLYTIQSVGLSEDSSVQRILTVAIGKLPGDTYPPNVPIVARGGLGLTGNVKAVNNEQNLTVWSGSDFGLNGSANTYVSIDGNPNQLSSIKNPGGNNIYGPDVVTNDPNLANAEEAEILQAFFGKAKVYEFSSKYTKGTGAQTACEASGGEGDTQCDFLDNFTDISSYNINNYDTTETEFYSNGDVTLGNNDVTNGTVPDGSITAWENQTGNDPDRNDLLTSGSVAGANLKFDNTAIIGTPSNPVRIVVDGKLTINSSPTIFGLIIADEIEFKGSPIIVGGVVVLDQVPEAVTGAGTPTIIMDKAVLDNTQASDSYGPIKNSWKDW